MKKVISFDLDGTLVSASYGNLVWLEGVPERYALIHGLTIDMAKQVVKDQYRSLGESNLLWYDLPYWIKRFELDVSINELLDQYESHIKLAPNVAETIEILSQDYSLVIASNAARIFVEKELGYTGISHCFTHIFSATSDFKMVKGQKDFYIQMCRNLGVSPSDVIHVGDHEVFDCEVPREAGISAYHYSPGGRSNGNTITDFRELKSYL
jgi:HAD superfamily hydrolase (TIGR01549 family)